MMKSIILSFMLISGHLLSNAQDSQLKLVSDDWPPFTGHNGEKAVALDLVDQALKRIDVKSELEILDFDDVLNGIESGKYDGSAALWKNDERQEYLLYSEPYLHNQLILVGKKGSDVSATSLDQLEGKRLGVVGNYAYGLSSENTKENEIIHGESDQQNLEHLLNDEVDYILVDALLIQYLMDYQRDEATQYLEIGDNTLLRKSLHFVIRKDTENAEKIISDFNKELTSMIVDGSYHRVLQLNWIHADIDGDGQIELVLDGNSAGLTPPTSSYAVFFNSQTSTTLNESTKYYVEGNFYQNWETIPAEYKTPEIKGEDLGKIGVASFKF